MLQQLAYFAPSLILILLLSIYSGNLEGAVILGLLALQVLGLVVGGIRFARSISNR
jgi:hypothetical protein